MSTYVDKPISLIEKKKQQWAKEKEELARLVVPWGVTNVPLDSAHINSTGNATAPRLTMVNSNGGEFMNKNYQNRRSSLPPLYKNQFNSIEKDLGGETSGYGSDNPHNNSNINIGGYESSTSFKDDRPKWRDKNHFWENNNENEPPNWVKRGLQQDVEIVVSNTSPAESPSQESEERPYTSSSSNNNSNRTYIRGQNIPMDSAEMAERERRRQIALTHQEAVRQQLEERERRRKEEKARRIKEEQEEELRIEREQEVERKRKEQELKQLREKQERERKRKEALEQAIVLAEKEAKVEKNKLKNTKENNDTNTDKNVEIVEKIDKENINNQLLALTPRPAEEKEKNLESASKEPKPQTQPQQTFQIITPRSEMAAFVLPTPSALDSLQMPYAVLVPSNATPIAIPISINPLLTDRSVQNTSRTENRLLTPTQYRNKKNKTLCDSSTQTDPSELSDSNNQNKFMKEKNTNLELNYDNRGRCNKDKINSAGRVEERPKWGANRPPTRYMKQSEKDLLYQRKKQRQKPREYKNSSDESVGSPRCYRKKNFGEKRRAMWRKNDHHYFARNIRMYQTEIVPLEVDKEQIYYRNKCECCRCGCTRSDILKIESPRVSLPDCSSNTENSSYVIDKMSSLHDGLFMKQEQWARSPRTPCLSSPSRNTEN